MYVCRCIQEYLCSYVRMYIRVCVYPNMYVFRYVLRIESSSWSSVKYSSSRYDVRNQGECLDELAVAGIFAQADHSPVIKPYQELECDFGYCPVTLGLRSGPRRCVKHRHQTSCQGCSLPRSLRVCHIRFSCSATSLRGRHRVEFRDIELPRKEVTARNINLAAVPCRQANERRREGWTGPSSCPMLSISLPSWPARRCSLQDANKNRRRVTRGARSPRAPVQTPPSGSIGCSCSWTCTDESSTLHIIPPSNGARQRQLMPGGCIPGRRVQHLIVKRHSFYTLHIPGARRVVW